MNMRRELVGRAGKTLLASPSWKKSVSSRLLSTCYDIDSIA